MVILYAYPTPLPLELGLEGYLQQLLSRKNIAVNFLLLPDPLLYLISLICHRFLNTNNKVKLEMGPFLNVSEVDEVFN